MYMYKRVVEAKLYIDQYYAEKIDLDQISDQAHFSKYHFLRLFKNAFGKSPHKYLTEVRLSHAVRLLKEGETIRDVCFKVGFESVPSFITLFKKHQGVTPNEFAKNIQQLAEAKQKIPFAFVPSCFADTYGWKQ